MRKIEQQKRDSFHQRLHFCMTDYEQNTDTFVTDTDTSENQRALMYFIGSEYMLHDDVANRVAEFCFADGISTWQQWADLDYTEKNSYINDVQVAYQPVPRK